MAVAAALTASPGVFAGGDDQGNMGGWGNPPPAPSGQPVDVTANPVAISGADAAAKANAANFTNVDTTSIQKSTQVTDQSLQNSNIANGGSGGAGGSGVGTGVGTGIGTGGNATGTGIGGTQGQQQNAAATSAGSAGNVTNIGGTTSTFKEAARAGNMSQFAPQLATMNLFHICQTGEEKTGLQAGLGFSTTEFTAQLGVTLPSTMSIRPDLGGFQDLTPAQFSLFLDKAATGNPQDLENYVQQVDALQNNPAAEEGAEDAQPRSKAVGCVMAHLIAGYKQQIQNNATQVKIEQVRALGSTATSAVPVLNCDQRWELLERMTEAALDSQRGTGNTSCVKEVAVVKYAAAVHPKARKSAAVDECTKKGGHYIKKCDM